MITAIPGEAPSVDGLELPALDIVPFQRVDALPSNPVTVGLLVIAVTGAPRWRATRVLVAHLVPVRAMVPREFHLGQKLAARAEDRLPVQKLRILMVGLLARGVARLAAVPSQILAIGAFALLPAPNSSRHPSRLSTALRAHTRTHTPSSLPRSLVVTRRTFATPGAGSPKTLLLQPMEWLTSLTGA